MQKYAVSAKTSQYVSNAFEELGKLIIQDIKMEMKESEWFAERKEAILQIQERKVSGQ